MANFFAMGGYGPFIWTGWGLTLLFVLLLWLHTETKLAKLHRQLEKDRQAADSPPENQVEDGSGG